MLRLAAAISLGYVAITTCEACPGATHSSPTNYARPHPGPVLRGFGANHDTLLGRSDLHPGVDIAARVGDTVTAIAAGKVVTAAHTGRLGLTVTIDHGDGIVSSYAHLAALFVKVGECIDAQVAVGRAGATGLITEPAVHFEVRKHNTPVDPLDFIAATK